jgi:hypothetical protein
MIFRHFTEESMTTHSKKTTALDLLKADHKKVKDLFDQFEDATGEEEKQEISLQVIKELKIHSVIEEEIFYPAIRKQAEQSELVDEAEEEHRVAKTLLEELEGMGSATEHFEAKFMVLAENVRHHIKEEESEVFSEAKKADIDLSELGEQMKERKEQLMNDENMLDDAVENSPVKPYQELAR